MNYKVRFDLKSEDGNYLLYSLDSNGFVDKTSEVTSEELPTLIKEFCDIAEPNGSDKLLDTLRTAYDIFELKSITLKEKKWNIKIR